MRTLARAVVVAALLSPVAAPANPLQTFGYNPRAVAMGGAMTAEAEGATACWYNPALLTRSDNVQIELGFQWARPVVGATDSFDRPIDYKQPPDYGGYTLGLLFPLAGKVRNRIAIGVGLYLPSSNILRTEMVDPGTPFWYVYDSAPDRIVVLPAISYKFTDWFSVGLGTQVLAAFGGGANVEVDALNRRVAYRELRNDLAVAQSPTAGLAFRPLPEWRIGASWRGELQLDFSLPTQVVLTDLGALNFDINGVAHYTPHTFALGTSYHFEELGLTLGASVEYQMWSRAPNPDMQIIVDMNGEVIDSLGLGSALDVATDAAEPGFQDVLVPRIGGEYAFGDRFEVRGGYFWRPSFVPDQTGRSNYLDNTVHGVSAGIGFRFDDPLEMFEEPLGLDITFQRQILESRVVQKLPEDLRGVQYQFGGSYNLFSIAFVHKF